MILDVDAGNTRLKWRLLDAGGAVCARGSMLSSSPDFSAIESQPLSRIRLASVLPPDTEAKLIDQVRGQWQIEPGLAKTCDQEHGLTNAYSEPSRLGVDRWLAMLAGYRRVQDAVCVVDAGTTLTVDFVQPDGLHAGGYIVPGHALMQDAVYGNTGRVLHRTPVTRPSAMPGRSTEEAVSHGALAALLGIVREGVEWLSGHAGRPAVLLVTGGGAQLLLEDLGGTAIWVEELVLEGLALQDPHPAVGRQG